jgi:hypothetical protein
MTPVPPDTSAPDAGRIDLCETKTCAKGMHCKAQNGDAQCVHDEPVKPLPPATCDTVECATGRHCALLEEGCDAGSCMPVATCVDDGNDPCAGVECTSGELCIVQNEQPLCIPESEARPCLLTPCVALEYCDDASGVALCAKQPDCGEVDCGENFVCRVTSSAEGCDTLPCRDQVSCEPCSSNEAEACLKRPCGNTHCEEGYHCEELEQIAHCINDNDACIGIACEPEHHCIPRTTLCILPPCPVVPLCVAD